VVINREAKTTLDKLFEGFNLKFDDIPLYPSILTKNDCLPRRTEMKDSIMKGRNEEGKPFIIIKLNHTIGDKELKQMEEYEKEFSTSDRFFHKRFYILKWHFDNYFKCRRL